MLEIVELEEILEFMRTNLSFLQAFLRECYSPAECFPHWRGVLLLLFIYLFLSEMISL